MMWTMAGTRTMLARCAAALRALLHAWALLTALAAPALAGPPEALSSVGEPALARLMSRWMAGLHAAEPRFTQGRPWRYAQRDTGIATLMFERADLVALTRAFEPGELAPYAHQFAGDMMRAPWTVRVAGTEQQPVLLAANQRPGAPLPERVEAFVRFALSPAGQALVAQDGQFEALSPADAQAQAARVQGHRVMLDPALPVYRAARPVHGELRSVGSDGMKTLMDRWLRDFRQLQPGVRAGARWEHLGTLNGLHALLTGETDLAPMGRELWPQERARHAAARGPGALLEIRVAHGGFNTAQRTTAQAVFVNAGNPLTRISVPQLAAILAQPPTLTRWGQLGLDGEWADRPIVPHLPPRMAPNTMSMQLGVLGGRAWNAAAIEDGVAATAAAVAADPGAIAFGGFEDGGPGLKTLAVAASDASQAVTADADSVASARYPLTRDLYIRIDRRRGQALPAAQREFLRYVLSREAQRLIVTSGYFPLTAAEAQAELAKLR